MADLITQTFLQQCAAAANPPVNLTAAQLAVVPQLIAAASRIARTHCNRYFSRLTYDGLYTVDNPTSRLILTRQYPVNQVLRVATDPTAVLTVNNSDTATNQRASATLVSTASTDIADLPVAVTGLKLNRLASAVLSSQTFAFLATTTVQDVADWVIGLGGGWNATVASGYAKWPVLDPENAGLCYFRPVQGAVPCLGANSAGLVMHVTDVAVQVREDTGELLLDPDLNDDPFTSLRFGSYLSTDIGDVDVYGGFNGLRVIYDAGRDTVPEDVQQAVVEIVLDMLYLLSYDQRLDSESDGQYSYKTRAMNLLGGNYAMPASALGKLSRHVNTRA